MLNNLKIKVCGMREKENISQLCKLHPDYIGFIFYSKSKRYVGKKIDNKILKSIPENIKKVGVFVNEDFSELEQIIELNKLNAVQLHGDETPEYCEKAKQKNVIVIKAFRVGAGFNFNAINEYKKYCDFFLFDTMTESFGGSGKKFNWDILKNFDNEKPIFLSGGISLNDAQELINLADIKNKPQNKNNSQSCNIDLRKMEQSFSSAESANGGEGGLNIHALDINSKFEFEPGVKNIELVKQFINKIRNE